jgi:hypothetical protein
MAIEALRRKLDQLLERFKAGRRRGLVLTMLAAARLAEKGEEISAETVRREALKIMEEHPGVDWGVSREEYTPGLVASLLKELADMGVLEPVGPWHGEFQRRFRIASYSDGDPLREIYARFGYLIFYGGPSR